MPEIHDLVFSKRPPGGNTARSDALPLRDGAEWKNSPRTFSLSKSVHNTLDKRVIYVLVVC